MSKLIASRCPGDKRWLKIISCFDSFRIIPEFCYLSGQTFTYHIFICKMVWIAHPVARASCSSPDRGLFRIATPVPGLYFMQGRIGFDYKVLYIHKKVILNIKMYVNIYSQKQPRKLLGEVTCNIYNHAKSKSYPCWSKRPCNLNCCKDILNQVDSFCWERKRPWSFSGSENGYDRRNVNNFP